MTDRDALRAVIERIDDALIGLIADRVRVARRVGNAKRAAGLPILDPTQEAIVIGRAATLARTAGLPEEEIRDIFRHLVALARHTQMGLNGGDEEPE